MTMRQIFAFTAALVFFAVPAVADQARIINIRIDGTPKFDVVYHRAKTNATGAVIGGIIGAGIQAGIEADRDGDKRKALAAHVSEDVWQSGFVKTLSETLLAKGFEPVWVEGKDSPKDAKADVYLVLFPASYGFRMVDSTTELVSAYVEFEASYASKPIAPRKSSKEPFYLTDRKQAAYDELAKETSVLNGEVEAVLSQAARRLANKIVYNVK
ncbi:hypothetical protein ACFPN2_19295 [Steroidobacter flavus]|uniref:Uncharacterized protein n=1 Tax=Steroidobacter flavus TaxID=1842136 RepID=A0ABV8SWC9_9GAMM